MRAVAFSGPASAARSLAELAAPGPIRCVFDLDGHTPVLVGEDADPAAIVAITGVAAFACAGQSGAAPSRYLVPRDLHDDFADTVSTYARSLVLGSARHPATTHGPVAGPARLDALVRSIGALVARCARLVTGGARRPQGSLLAADRPRRRRPGGGGAPRSARHRHPLRRLRRRTFTRRAGCGAAAGRRHRDQPAARRAAGHSTGADRGVHAATPGRDQVKYSFDGAAPWYTRGLPSCVGSVPKTAP
ncbi:aldehyde dehydrogenase family protein [Amycolatopsis sp. FDAARGOS 1241]|nr:aldehyde dehydrogenase family protein [Amycolatopsis sp. FDAARGOS 1241]